MSSFDVDIALFLNAEERSPYITPHYTNRYQKERPSIFLEIAVRTNINKAIFFTIITNKNAQEKISKIYSSFKKLYRYILYS